MNRDRHFSVISETLDLDNSRHHNYFDETDSDEDEDDNKVIKSDALHNLQVNASKQKQKRAEFDNQRKKYYEKLENNYQTNSTKIVKKEKILNMYEPVINE